MKVKDKRKGQTYREVGTQNHRMPFQAIASCGLDREAVAQPSCQGLNQGGSAIYLRRG